MKKQRIKVEVILKLTHVNGTSCTLEYALKVSMSSRKFSTDKTLGKLMDWITVNACSFVLR